MTTSIVDCAELIRGLLDTNWNASNCSKPSIALMVDAARGNEDYNEGIRIYNLVSTEIPHGLGYTHTDVRATVSIQISTQTTNTSAGRTQFWKLVNEVRRVIYDQRKTPGSDYHVITPIRCQDLTNKRTGVYKMVIDVEIIRYAESI